MDKQAEIARIKAEYEARNREIDRQHRQEMAKIIGGGLLQGASFHPIFNIPYVGTGLGGAMFEAGNAIMEGKSWEDIKNDTGRGFLIGEAVGFLPPVVQKLSKTKAGQAVVKGADDLVKRLADTPIVKKVEDVLTTDIRGLNPNKQIAYHGSKKDFDKFDNKYIGTGEKNQAHGYGHYSALNKDIADVRYRKRLSSPEYTIDGKKLDDPFQVTTLNDVLANGKANIMSKYEKTLLDNKKIVDDFESKYTKNELFKNDDLYLPYSNAQDEYMRTLERYDFLKDLDENAIRKNEGQLYKLAIPKENTFLREDLFLNKQPQFQNIYDDVVSINPEKYGNMFNKKWMGRDLYFNLQRDLGSDELATKYLQDRGVKGISYNGGIDGEARVIFDPNDIDIIKKYYNQPNLSDIMSKNVNMGTFINALLNEQE